MNSCRDICRWAQACHVKNVNEDPDTCIMACKLEDYAWDAECEMRGEEEDRRRDEEDYAEEYED